MRINPNEYKDLSDLISSFFVISFYVFFFFIIPFSKEYNINNEKIKIFIQVVITSISLLYLIIKRHNLLNISLYNYILIVLLIVLNCILILISNEIKIGKSMIYKLSGFFIISSRILFASFSVLLILLSLKTFF